MFSRYGAMMGHFSNNNLVYGADRTKTILMNHLDDMSLYIDNSFLVNISDMFNSQKSSELNSKIKIMQCSIFVVNRASVFQLKRLSLLYAFSKVGQLWSLHFACKCFWEETRKAVGPICVVLMAEEVKKFNAGKM